MGWLFSRVEHREPWREARKNAFGLFDGVHEGKVSGRDGWDEGKGWRISTVRKRGESGTFWFKSREELGDPIISFISASCTDKTHISKSRAIDKIPRTLVSIGETILQQTGWHVSILCGGPTPNANGNTMTFLWVEYSQNWIEFELTGINRLGLITERQRMAWTSRSS